MLSPGIILYVFSTSGGGGGGGSVHQRDIMIHLGRYHEYTGVGVFSTSESTSGDTIIHVGQQIDKSL